jgi:hypothetical protein
MSSGVPATNTRAFATGWPFSLLVMRPLSMPGGPAAACVAWVDAVAASRWELSMNTLGALSGYSVAINSAFSSA